MLHGSVVFAALVSLIAKNVWACNSINEYELHNEAKLHDDLLCNYKSDYRPVKDHKSTVTVKVRFALKYITFDSLEETITIHSWLAITWKDEFLHWNPSDYGDIKELQIESHEIWTPRLSLFNADPIAYQSDTIYTTCLVNSDGTVTCVPHLAHTGICRTQLRNWPYDKQNCSLFFGAWMHSGEQINFTFYKTKPLVLEDFQNGPGWKLFNVTNEWLPGYFGCCPNSTYPMLKYTFRLERVAAGPAAIVVIPTIVIILLTLSSLLLDIKDNTRLFLACFSLFSHFIFLTEIGYDIPKHSADTPIILLFIRDSMIITLMAILETLFLMYLRTRTDPAYTWVVSLNRLVSNGPGRYVVFTEFDPSDVTERKSLSEDVAGSMSNEDRSQATSAWIQFANFLNSCIFIFSLVIYLILLCVYIPKE